ncbi:hypothetical protein QC762_205370 [Podospora pseudocomata]|uniref:Uncharacterized protein n=1 Tax=Podospora pseudocomata TaxID=2093779 RepID=A0ABR0GLP2_9PEZI|nr:hypothetical protein QC762_205370 [Podospora pseudocomata]
MAVNNVQIFQLGIRDQFNGVTEREQRYAHHMARVAWYGARIILEQVSPESRPIFDFILELYRAFRNDFTRTMMRIKRMSCAVESKADVLRMQKDEGRYKEVLELLNAMKVTKIQTQ